MSNSANSENSKIVTINDVSLTPIEVNGQRVVTLAMIDKVHGRPDGTAGRNFRENRERLVPGKHFNEITQPDEIRRLGFSRPQGGIPAKVILMTERGYLMLVKSLTDDLAWEVQDALVESYFTKSAAAVPAALSRMQLIQLAYEAEKEKEAERAQRIALENLNAELAPKADALDRISASEGSVTFTQAAKIVGVKQDTMTRWMHSHGWVYRQNGSWVAYAQHIQNGRLEYKEANYTDQKTGMKVSKPYCHITPKGLAKLAVELGAAA